MRVEFAYDGGGLGKDVDINVCLDGRPVGTGRLGHTEPIALGYEHTDRGPGDNVITGTIKWIEMESDDGQDHLADLKTSLRGTSGNAPSEQSERVRREHWPGARADPEVPFGGALVAAVAAVRC